MILLHLVNQTQVMDGDDNVLGYFLVIPEICKYLKQEYFDKFIQLKTTYSSEGCFQ